MNEFAWDCNDDTCLLIAHSKTDNDSRTQEAISSPGNRSGEPRSANLPKVSQRNGVRRPGHSACSGKQALKFIDVFFESLAVGDRLFETTCIVGQKGRTFLPSWTAFPAQGRAYLAILEIERKGDARAITINIPDTIVDEARAGKFTIHEWANREFDELRRSVYSPAGIELDFVLVIETRQEGHRKRPKHGERQRYDAHGVFNCPGAIHGAVIRHFATRLGLRRRGQRCEAVRRRILVPGKGLEYLDDLIRPTLLADPKTGVSIKIKPLYDSSGWGWYCVKGISETPKKHGAVVGTHPEIISLKLRGKARDAWERQLAGERDVSGHHARDEATEVASALDREGLLAAFERDGDVLARVFRQVRCQPGMHDARAARRLVESWWELRAPYLACYDNAPPADSGGYCVGA